MAAAGYPKVGFRPIVAGGCGAHIQPCVPVSGEQRAMSEPGMIGPGVRDSADTGIPAVGQRAWFEARERARFVYSPR